MAVSFEGEAHSYEELRQRVEAYLDGRCRRGACFLDIVGEFRRGELPEGLTIGQAGDVPLREESRQTWVSALADWGRDIERAGDPLAGALVDALLEEEWARSGS